MSKNEVKTPVEVSAKKLVELVNEGKNIEEIGQAFGLTLNQTRELIKEAKSQGLEFKIKRKVTPAFKLVMDNTNFPEVTNKVDVTNDPDLLVVQNKKDDWE